jgi:glutamine amidotransferase
MIAIIDYKMGNIQSLKNALNFLGAECCVTNDSDVIIGADKIILPGVGAFNIAMKNLQGFNLIGILNQAVFDNNTPILGICLGMQILADIGEEDGPTEGLGWIDGQVKRFSFSESKLRIPHIGFNSVYSENKNPNLFSGLKNGSDFYFVHSYRMACKENSDVSSWAYYGEKFVSSVQKDNVFGVQFHPEKSQSNGLTVLKNFISLRGGDIKC